MRSGICNIPHAFIISFLRTFDVSAFLYKFLTIYQK